MSEENKQKSSTPQTLLYVLIAAAVDGVLWTAGFFCRRFISCGSRVYFCSIALLLICFVLSNIAFRLFFCFIRKTTVEDSNKRVEKLMNRIAKHPKWEWVRFRILCIAILCYILLLLLTSMAIPFFYGTSGLFGISAVGNLLSMYYLMGFVSRIPFGKTKNDYSRALNEKEYPVLHGLVKKAAGNTSRYRKIHIFVCSDPNDSHSSAFISAPDNRNIVIGLGTILLSVLDEEELLQVLLHEFGHMDGEDICRKRLYTFLKNFIMKAPKLAICSILDWSLNFFGMYLFYRGERYFRFVSKQEEEKADQYAKALGKPEKLASAFAKMYCHDYFLYETIHGESYYAPAEIPQHWHFENAKKYLDSIPCKEALWRQLLEQGLPNQRDTHPTFRQRWEALGCCSYSLSPAPPDTPFAQECRKVIEKADKELCESLAPYYEQDRQLQYLHYLKIIQEFEIEKNNLSADELRPVIIAYSKVGMPEAAEQICETILDTYDSPFTTAFASYMKGFFLLHRYDKAGLHYMWQAMENNSNYITEGLEEIGTFVRMMGLQEELDYYLQHSIMLRQRLWDRNTPGITARAKLTACELPDGWLDKIMDYIRSVGDKHIEKVYLVKELSNEDYQPTSFILRFRELEPDEELSQTYEQIYDKIFCLLDDWPDDWEFALYLYEPDMEKVLSRTKGCCIFDCTAN